MGQAQGRPFIDATKVQRVNGIILARPKDGADPSEVEAFISNRPGLRIHHTIDPLNILVMHFPEFESRFNEHAEALSGSDLFQFVEADYVGVPLAVVPNDPGLSSQGYARQCKFESPADGFGAWDLTTGSSNTVIGFIDTGVDLTHPDLSSKINPGWNFINNTNSVQDDGCSGGHGTAIAGVLGAITNNSVGMSGMGYNCKLMPLLACDASCSITWSNLAAACVWAADHGAKVINISMGGPTDTSTLEAGLKYAYDAGVILIAASGNSGNSTPMYPARSPYCISVGAVNADDTISSFSETGTAVDIYAPGNGIYTTQLGGSYWMTYGTSLACPIVVAAVALALTLKSTLKPSDIKTLLLDPVNCDITAAGLKRLNARKFVAAANAASPVTDSTNPTISITSPATGATVAGTITIQGVSADNVGVTRVDLKIDGSVVQSSTTPNFIFHYDTTATTNASHTIACQAFDAAGNNATASISVTVNNPTVTDLTPPVVTITSPANGDLATGVMHVAIAATDAGNVVYLSLYVDNVLVGTNSPTPSTSVTATINWNTKKARRGLHTLQATGRDASGNVGWSPVITVSK